MDAFRSEDIERSGDWCGRRRDKNSEASILEFFDNERDDETCCNFGQRWLPHIVFRAARQFSSRWTVAIESSL
jgi:hypothetical protein